MYLNMVIALSGSVDVRAERSRLRSPLLLPEGDPQTRSFMTTQSTVYPDSKLTPDHKSMPGDRSMSETIEATIPELKAQLRHMIESGKTRVSEAAGGLQDGIRAKPVQSRPAGTAEGSAIAHAVFLGRPRPFHHA